MESRHWTGVAAGAVLATVAVVGLYEGKAKLAPSEPHRAAGAASVRPPAGDREVVSQPLREASSPLSSLAVPTASAAGEASAAARGTRQLEQVKAKLADVQREKRDLEGQLHSLENELAQRPRGSPAGEAQEFDLDRGDWKQLAAESRIKYRIPCALPADSSYAIPHEQLDELGLSPDDGRTLLEAHRRSNARVWATLRPLCVKAIGDDTVVDLLGRSNCVGVIERAATQRDLAAAATARRQVGEVHAGLRAPPEADPSTPLFAALLALTSEAQRFEADLTESFGPDEAQRIVQFLPCADTTR